MLVTMGPKKGESQAEQEVNVKDESHQAFSFL